MAKGLIILDRDGVLNEVVIHPEHGTIDSPLNPDEVTLCKGAATAVAALTRAGYTLAIATNQPAWAKGKTTETLLRATHQRVVDLLEAEGGKISSSHLCVHRREDRCDCRKPAAGLLLEAIARHPDAARQEVWMIGDGVTDVQAGRTAGAKTGFLGPRKCDACKILDNLDLRPDFWGDTLEAFSNIILQRS